MKDKTKTFFYKLAGKYRKMAISTITKYEVYVGSNELQDQFWNNLLENITLLPFDDLATIEAIKIQKQLLKKNKIIGFGDVAIGATAKAKNIPIATMNVKHFRRIENLKIAE